MAYTIENVTDASSLEMVEYLKRHEERTLFLLGNFEAYGYKMTDAPYSGNFKLVRYNSYVVGVFCLSKKGNLIIQSDVQEPIFELLLQSCTQENIQLVGLLGNWEIASKLWDFLKAKNVIKNEHYVSKEILYSIETSKQSDQIEPNVRLLTQVDYESWKSLRLAYIKELGFPCDLTNDQMLDQFLWKTKQKITWGRFQDGQLASIGDLNAKALDLGQVGGVFTTPAFRQRGFAKSLMHKLIQDAKMLHAIRKIIIFTGEKNHPARRVYESLKIDQIGHYGVFFGNSVSR